MSVGKIYTRKGFEYWYDRTVKVWYAGKVEEDGGISRTFHNFDRTGIECDIDRVVSCLESGESIDEAFGWVMT